MLGPHRDGVLLDHGDLCPEHREQVLCQPWNWRVLPHVGGHQVERARSLHKLALGLGAWPEGARAPHRGAKKVQCPGSEGLGTEQGQVLQEGTGGHGGALHRVAP